MFSLRYKHIVCVECGTVHFEILLTNHLSSTPYPFKLRHTFSVSPGFGPTPSGFFYVLLLAICASIFLSGLSMGYRVGFLRHCALFAHTVLFLNMGEDYFVLETANTLSTPHRSVARNTYSSKRYRS